MRLPASPVETSRAYRLRVLIGFHGYINMPAGETIAVAPQTNLVPLLLISDTFLNLNKYAVNSSMSAIILNGDQCNGMRELLT